MGTNSLSGWLLDKPVKEVVFGCYGHKNTVFPPVSNTVSPENWALLKMACYHSNLWNCCIVQRTSSVLAHLQNPISYLLWVHICLIAEYASLESAQSLSFSILKGVSPPSLSFHIVCVGTLYLFNYSRNQYFRVSPSHRPFQVVPKNIPMPPLPHHVAVPVNLIQYGGATGKFWVLLVCYLYWQCNFPQDKVNQLVYPSGHP